MFECFSEPNGGYSIMAIDESKEAYIHVVRVLLDAAIDSPIDLLLRADNCTSIARLRQLIKIPGLHERSELFRLNEEQHEDLLAIESYINWTNNSGYFDITTETRGSFDGYIGCHFDPENPTEYDEREATASLLRILRRYAFAASPEESISLYVEIFMTDIARDNPRLKHLLHGYSRNQMARQLHHTDVRDIISERDPPHHMTTSVLPKDDVDVLHPGDIRRVLWQPAKNTRLLSKDDDDDDLHPADIRRVLSQPAKMPKPREMTDEQLEAGLEAVR